MLIAVRGMAGARLRGGDCRELHYLPRERCARFFRWTKSRTPRETVFAGATEEYSRDSPSAPEKAPAKQRNEMTSWKE